MDVTPGETVMGFMDADTLADNITNYTMTKLGSADSDNLLEDGEIIEFTVDVSGYGLEKLTDFIVRVKAAQGATVTIARTIPATISATMNLN